MLAQRSGQVNRNSCGLVEYLPSVPAGENFPPVEERVEGLQDLVPVGAERKGDILEGNRAPADHPKNDLLEIGPDFFPNSLPGRSYDFSGISEGGPDSFELFHGKRSGPGIRRRANDRIEVNPVRSDGIDDLFKRADVSGPVIDSLDKHDLKPDLAAVFLPEFQEAVENPVGFEKRMGTVDLAENGGCRGVKGGDNEVRGEKIFADFPSIEKGAVRQNGHGDAGPSFDPPDKGAKVFIESRLP